MGKRKEDFAISALRSSCKDLLSCANDIRKYSEELKSTNNYYRVACIGDSVETLSRRLSLVLNMEVLLNDSK